MRQGAVRRLFQAADGPGWRAAEVARVDALPPGLAPGDARLLVADLDNNGAADLIVAGNGGLPRAPERRPRHVQGPRRARWPWALEPRPTLDGDGRLDLLGLDDGGSPAPRGRARGAKAYHWQVLRPRAATATGDQRINSFGIGGEIEIRSGLARRRSRSSLRRSRALRPRRGRRRPTSCASSGRTACSSRSSTRAADTAVLAEQRLKGSCPWLFAWNGTEMPFVTDFLWRSPLGLRINAQATADVLRPRTG